MASPRDPISEWFDPAAIRLLERAYANMDGWTGVYLARPTARQREAAQARYGINVDRPDNHGDGTRWVRAFKRAVYYNLKNRGNSRGIGPASSRADNAWPPYPLEWQTGQLVMREGWARRHWAIRVCLHSERGEAAHRAAIEKVPPSRRWAIGGGAPGRRSTRAHRDY